jgi:hypothetical protein
MTDTSTQPDLLNWQEEPKKRSDMLNVLTILTFIGSGWFGLSSFYSFFTSQSSYEKLVAMQSKLDDAPAIVKKFMGPEMLEMARKSMENRIPILLLTLVSCGLCLYGAIQMRGLKKTGFSIYVIGEILPIVTAFMFVGLASFGGFGVLFAFLIPIVFIILYATQLKNLK